MNDTRPDSTTQTPEVVSVVMPVKNEARFIGAALDALLGQTFPSDRFEIMVVDGGSADDTVQEVRQRAERDARIHLIETASANCPESMNIGASETSGQYLAKVDGHGYVNREFLATAVRLLNEDDGIGCVGGRIVPLASGSVQGANAIARFSRFGVGSGPYTAGSGLKDVQSVQCGVYRRDALESVGGFDANLQFGEDEEVNHRLIRSGWRIVQTPGMSYSYHVRPTLTGLFRQYFRYGKARAAVVERHPDFLRPKHLAPALLVATLAASAVALPFERLQAPAAAVWLAYVAFLLFGAGTLAVRHRFARMDLLVGSLLSLHIGYGVGTLAGLWDWLALPRSR
jgi:succinoglycan biosynthesis protein ExoA